MRYWIIPCNPKKYDIIQHFKDHDIVIWKYHYGIIVDDIAFIYLSSPYQEVRYKCRVIDKCVDEQTVNENAYAKRENVTRYIALKLEKEYPSGSITYKNLKECKLGQVLNICVAGERIQNFIHEVETSLE